MPSRRTSKQRIQAIRSRPHKARKPRPDTHVARQPNEPKDTADHTQQDLTRTAQAQSNLVPYNPRLLNRSRLQLQLGDWEKLADLDDHELQHNPAAAELQLLAAAGHLQKGGEHARSRARALLDRAIGAGMDSESVARILIGGASNTLGRIAALTHRPDQKVMNHFRSAIALAAPDADIDLVLKPTATRQLISLAEASGSSVIWEMAQYAAMGQILSNSSPVLDASIRPRVAVAGIPRSGTTMTFRAIAGLPPGSTTPKDYAGPHVKTHTFEPSTLVNKVDVAIFLFGDVVDSVVSTREKRFDAGHFRNCGAEHLSPETSDLYEADHLNYEKMFDAWMRPNGIPHVCVRYDRIHELADIVEKLLGCQVPLPEKKSRTTRVRSADRFRIESAYASLIQKVRLAPDLCYFR
ncbi:hypothetical protein [Wenzhouxiangella limi]|uniref:Uncharacterized protein n=1 Tax=Wenzhouxiangella limi TaxID=2707351 RepID=A0A845UXY7_9GAMM|nr:hypothetical protein [Wenzhouxiangella limi]NDY96287.1 hypothetical protein [Wenzhouxiangella limi]